MTDPSGAAAAVQEIVTVPVIEWLAKHYRPRRLTLSPAVPVAYLGLAAPRKSP
jgi:hypothetical protein